jgi:hypothetical protein
VIKMDRVDRFRKYRVSRADQTLKEGFVGIISRSLTDLNNERSLRFKVALEEADDLFEVIDIVGPDGVLAIGMLKKFLGGYDHIQLLG